MSLCAADIPTAVYCPEAPVHPTNPPAVDHTVLLRVPISVSASRRWVRDTLDKFKVPESTIDDAVQIVSEFAQNAVVHVPAADPDEPGVMTVTVAVWDGRLRLTVSDPGDMFDHSACGPSDSGEHGFGIVMIVNELSKGRWGTEAIPGGKLAFAELVFGGAR